MNPYETEKILNEYLLFHYGTPEEILGDLPGPRDACNFPSRCVSELLDADSLPPRADGCDLGCAVGRASFELARYCETVTAIDSSQSFIEASRTLKNFGLHRIFVEMEAGIRREAVVRVPPEIRRDGVFFQTGDALALSPDLGSFDVLLAANLVCRLRDPRGFLDQLPGLLKAGGQLLLTTPFTWLEEFTPRDAWLGGSSSGKTSFDVLEDCLSPFFRLEATRDMPFLIREHVRKFQYVVALGSRWRRR